MKPSMALAALGFAVLALLMGGAQAFDNDELEIFDLVEEVNKNFYEYLELDVDGKATTNEIRKAYKKLALVWHPDKSDAEDAEVRTIQYIYVLRSYLSHSTLRGNTSAGRNSVSGRNFRLGILACFSGRNFWLVFYRPEF